MGGAQNCGRAPGSELGVLPLVSVLSSGADASDWWLGGRRPVTLGTSEGDEVRVGPGGHRLGVLRMGELRGDGERGPHSTPDLPT